MEGLCLVLVLGHIGYVRGDKMEVGPKPAGCVRGSVWGNGRVLLVVRKGG